MIDPQLALFLVFIKYKLCIIYLLKELEIMLGERIRRWGVKPFNSHENRLMYGAYTTVYSYFKNNDHEEFYKYTRMDIRSLAYLSGLVRPKLQKNYRGVSLDLELIRLISIINCLAHGMPVTGQAWSYRIGCSTMYQLIPEICEAIYEALASSFMSFPQEDEWKEIARQIYLKWNCVGSIDGKHIEISAPDLTGSAFFNFKSYFSLVALATSDPYLRFTWANVGGYGASNDASLFRNCDLNLLLQQKGAFLPDPDYLPGTKIKFPYYFIGDSAFPLQEYLLTPYSRNKNLTIPQRVYNYRICRARRLIENAFGLWTRNWRIFEGPIYFKLETVENIVLARMCLHNFIITMEMDLPEEKQQYTNNIYNLENINK